MREVTAEHVKQSLQRHEEVVKAHPGKTIQEFAEPAAAFREYIGIKRDAADEISAAIFRIYPKEVAPFVMTGLQIGILAARLAEEEG
jgi:hypothetical protein